MKAELNDIAPGLIKELIVTYPDGKILKTFLSDDQAGNYMLRLNKNLINEIVDLINSTQI